MTLAALLALLVVPTGIKAGDASSSPLLVPPTNPPSQSAPQYGAPPGYAERNHADTNNPAFNHPAAASAGSFGQQQPFAPPAARAPAALAAQEMPSSRRGWSNQYPASVAGFEPGISGQNLPRETLPEPSLSDANTFGQPSSTDEAPGIVPRVLDRPLFNNGDVYPTGDPEPYFEPYFEEPWTFQLLPTGLIYRSYLAGVREARLGFTSLSRSGGGGKIWEAMLGGRVAFMRWGTTDPFFPQGWEIDFEGVSLTRIDPTEGQDVDANDYHFGIPVTYGTRHWEFKFAYYHLCSHVGDEWLIKHPDFQRINYVRNAFLLGLAWRAALNLRIYGEVGYAFDVDGGAEPWETQFGLEYRPGYATGLRGAPFLAVNTHLSQELSWGGYFTAQAGWAWRGLRGGQMLRFGYEYYNGADRQASFLGKFEQQSGLGLWYDF